MKKSLYIFLGKRRHDYFFYVKKVRKDIEWTHTENRQFSGNLGKFESFFRKILDSFLSAPF